MSIKHKRSSDPALSSRSILNSGELMRRLTPFMVLSFCIFALLTTLASARPALAFFFWFVLPVCVFLLLVNYERLVPLWIVTVMFPVQVPVGGALIPLNILMGMCIVLVGLIRHAIKEDVIVPHNFPWSVRVILFALILAYIRNPALPTGNALAHSEIGSGFRRYFTEGVQWAAVVYVFFYIGRLKDTERLMSFFRWIIWCAVIVKTAVLTTRTPILYTMIGENLETLVLTGYIQRFFFVTAAIAGGLQATLCWRPSNLAGKIVRYALVVACFVALGFGGTRSDVLLGVACIGSYLFLRKKFLMMAIVATLMAGLYLSFMYVPAMREKLPERYHRIFVYSSQAVSLAYVDAEMAETAMGNVNWRMSIARLAAKDIAASPLIGHGVRSAVIQPYMQSKEDIYRRAVHFVLTHNFYLDHMLLLGIPATLMLLWWLGGTMLGSVRIIWRDPKNRTHSLLGYCTLTIPNVLMVGLFTSSLTPIQLLHCAITAALIGRYRRQTIGMESVADSHGLPPCNETSEQP